VLSNHHLIIETYANESSPNVNIRDIEANGSPVRDFGSEGLSRLQDTSLLTTYIPPSNVITLSHGVFGVLIPEQNGLTLEHFEG
jgi:hypothetical protein